MGGREAVRRRTDSSGKVPFSIAGLNWGGENPKARGVVIIPGQVFNY